MCMISELVRVNSEKDHNTITSELALCIHVWIQVSVCSRTVLVHVVYMHIHVHVHVVYMHVHAYSMYSKCMYSTCSPHTCPYNYVIVDRCMNILSAGEQEVRGREMGEVGEGEV